MHQNALVLIRFFVLLCSTSILLNCTTGKSLIKKKFTLKFLDEFVIENDTLFPTTKIGGLSGIDYNPVTNKYIFVSDDSSAPRYYIASIDLVDKKIKNIHFDSIIYFQTNKGKKYDSLHFDLEGIRFFDAKNIIISSEGAIKHKKDPFISIYSNLGNLKESYMLPPYFKPTSNINNTPRHNGTLEAIAPTINKKGFWIAMELPLQEDGDQPNFYNAGAPVRFTYFDTLTKRATKQFVYPLDKLEKDPKGKFGVNGVTDILQLTSDSFLVLERSYSVGYGIHGNTVRLYLTTTKNVTNTLDFVSLKNATYNLAQKTLLFDFESVLSQLSNQSIDNIEGITFGPKLKNGNQTLFLVSDNNFNSRSKQKNQIIALEILVNKQ
ncbi:esterase-like activity of phytase family protein [Aquimarina sp. W85]|uniref:esterase-like activity of phytase family protein n=1 Tax=Aquimarina rhodophyticola TaxID=3342246 RepID=UPI00366FD23A